MASDISTSGFRLASLSIPAKVMLTAFVGILGLGYLSAVGNIYFQHNEADLEPGMSLDDLRRVYHGLEKEVTARTPPAESPMQKMVKPGGVMRKYAERGGEPAVRALMAWLEGGAKREEFARSGISQDGDPAAQEVIAENCVRCHNSVRGEKTDAPYAADRDSPPDYDLVIKFAAPPVPVGGESKTLLLEPAGLAHLVHVTHAHILTIPVFTLIIGALFFLTGQRPTVKAILGPLPMVAVCCDICSWWLARPLEPFIYVIAAAGGVFGAALGLQILCILGSLWFGRKREGTA